MEGSFETQNKEELTKLKPGDLIRFYNECDEHWAVFDGKDEKGEQIIHWWMGNGDDSSPRIQFDSFWTFAKNMVAEKENGDCIEHMNVVERTKEFKQMLEKEETKGKDKAYQDIFYSSEHFAKWCHYGLGGLDSKWGPPAPALVIDITKVKNVVEFVEGIFTNHTSDGKAIRRNIDVLKQLQPGDIVRFSRDSYKHWATYIGQTKDEKSLKSVIHWWDNDSATDPYIRIVPFWELAGNCTAEKINTDELGKVAIAESEAVERAEALINKCELAQKGQDVKADMFHCSEDFAKWFYLKLMGKAESTVSMTGLTEEHHFVWKCCEHDIAAHLGKGRHLLNEEVLLTLEHYKFSLLLVKILEKIMEKFQEIEMKQELWQLLEREPEKPFLQLVERMKSFLRGAAWPDFGPLKVISETVERMKFFSRGPAWPDFGLLEVISETAFSGERLQQELKRRFPEKEYDKPILQLVEIFSAIVWQFVGITKRQFEEPDEITLHLDPCAIFTRMKNVEILQELKPGDLIKYVKNSWNHWGVCIRVIPGLNVFHWTADEHVTEPNRCCIETEFVFTLDKAEKLEKINGDKLEDTIIDGAEVVERVKAFEAKIREGEKSGKDFSDLFIDCEHFAKWCRYRLGLKSLKISKEQIEKIKDIRNFVKGEFSVIPWLIDSNEDIPVSRLRQLKKSEAGGSSSLTKWTSEKLHSVPSSST